MPPCAIASKSMRSRSEPGNDGVWLCMCGQGGGGAEAPEWQELGIQQSFQGPQEGSGYRLLKLEGPL